MIHFLPRHFREVYVLRTLTHEEYDTDKWKHEADVTADEANDLSPIDMLRYLMEGHDMSASDLGRLLGNRERGPAILRGDDSGGKISDGERDIEEAVGRGGEQLAGALSVATPRGHCWPSVGSCWL